MAAACCNTLCKLHRTAVGLTEAFAARRKAAPRPTVAGTCSSVCIPRVRRDVQDSRLLLMCPLRWRDTPRAPAGRRAQTCLCQRLGISRCLPSPQAAPVSFARG